LIYAPIRALARNQPNRSLPDIAQRALDPVQAWTNLSAAEITRLRLPIGADACGIRRLKIEFRI